MAHIRAASDSCRPFYQKRQRSLPGCGYIMNQKKIEKKENIK
jgi:hypothetical protein